MVALTVGCAVSPSAGPSGVAGDGAIVVATVSSDYATGALAVLDPSARTLVDGVASTSGDPAVDVGDDVVYEINRFAWDAVQVLEADDLGSVRLEFSTGEGTNPQGVAACGDTLWVPLYERAEIGWFDAVSGARVGGVDLAAWSDADGLPEVAAPARVADLVVVPLQRLDRLAGWLAADDGRVLTFRCGSAEPQVDHVVGANPRVVAIPGDAEHVGVVVGGPQGGVYEVDALASDTLLRIDASSAGGEAFAAAWDENGAVVVLGHDDAWTWQISCVAPDGQVMVGERVGHFLSAVETDGVGAAWVSARSGFSGGDEAGGLWRVDLADCTVSDRLAPALPPFDLVRR